MASIARIHVPVERRRVIQLTTLRILLRPPSETGIVIARPVLIQSRAAVEVATGKTPGVRHRPGRTCTAYQLRNSPYFLTSCHPNRRWFRRGRLRQETEGTRCWETAPLTRLVNHTNWSDSRRGHTGRSRPACHYYRSGQRWRSVHRRGSSEEDGKIWSYLNKTCSLFACLFWPGA